MSPMISFATKRTRLSLGTGLLLVLLVLLALATVVAHVHLGSVPAMHVHPLTGTDGGPGEI